MNEKYETFFQGTSIANARPVAERNSATLHVHEDKGLTNVRKTRPSIKVFLNQTKK